MRDMVCGLCLDNMVRLSDQQFHCARCQLKWTVESTANARQADDHPRGGPHYECRVDHKGRGVPAHCSCGARWPCPLRSIPRAFA